MTFISYPVQSGQSIYDVATQVYGSIECVMLILEDNPSINLNSSMNGIILQIRQELAPTLPDVATAKWFRTQQQIVNNNDNPENYEDAWLTEDGLQWLTEDGLYWNL
jgi:hypothetical protein